MKKNDKTDVDIDDEGGIGKKKILIAFVSVTVTVGVVLAMILYFGGFGHAGPPVIKPPSTVSPAITDQHGSIIGYETNKGTISTGETPEVTSPDPITQLGGTYTFLVVGFDQGRLLTDVLMLVVYDTNAGTFNVLSIPRDTYSMANNRSGGLKHINLAYSQGGIDQLLYEVKNLVGYEVNWYVTIQMEGFVKLINYIGGVEFNVPVNMYYTDKNQGLYINLQRGTQILNGAKALQLVRYRNYFNADIGRINVRNDFLKAAASQLLKSHNITKAAELAGTVFDNVKTNMSKNDLLWFAKQAVGLKVDNIEFHTIPGDGAYDSGMFIPFKNELLTLINEKFNPFDHEITYINIVQRAENKGK